MCAVLATGSAAAAGEKEPGGKGVPGSNWEVTVGGGVGFAPKYEGGKDLEVSPVPFVSATYGDRFFIGIDKGLGANLWTSDDFNLAVAANFAGGRQRKDGRLLRALDEVDPGASLSVTASYTVFQFLSFSADVSREVGASDGFQVQLGVGAAIPVTNKLSFSAGVSTTWADDQYMKTYFGIGAAAAARSGLRAFDAKADFKTVGFNVGAAYQITDHWTLVGQVGVGFLLGDAAGSPIVETDVQPSAAFGLGYRF